MDLIIFLIGPISNFVLAAIFNNNKFILSINLSLGIINLLPMYPLDGFRIFECLGINSKIFDFIVYFMFFLLFIYTKNISLIIFVMYIMCIKLKKIRKM